MVILNWLIGLKELKTPARYGIYQILASPSLFEVEFKSRIGNNFEYTDHPI